ncbi:hypothetical protein GF352_03485 [archaeon]|nr:hypothetical protein [archaeon]
MSKRLLAALFIISTSFFMVQHAFNVSWDFSVFFLNSRYLLFNHGFFEIRRPPLPAFLMFFGEYFYIFFVSLVGLYACVKFSNRYSLNPVVFYSLILSPYVLFTGFAVGTEFLTLALTLLLFTYIKDELSGFFFGLSFLAHYTNASSVIFLFFKRDWRRIIGSLLLAFLVIAPWFLFNYWFKADPFYSFWDSYAQNVSSRSYYDMSFNLFDLLIVSSFLFPLFLVGLSRFRRDSFIDWLMLFFFLVRLGNYFFIPLKIPRYLFGVVIPVAYFSAKSLNRFNYRASLVVASLTIIFSAFFYSPLFYLESPSIYTDNLVHFNDSCMVMSNAWPFLNYYGVDSGPSPRKQLVVDYLNQGYTLVFFKHIRDPSYPLNESFISSLPVSYDSYQLVVLSNESVCLPSYSYNLSYIEEMNNTYHELHNSSFSFTIWDLLKSEE